MKKQIALYILLISSCMISAQERVLRKCPVDDPEVAYYWDPQYEAWWQEMQFELNAHHAMQEDVKKSLESEQGKEVKDVKKIRELLKLQKELEDKEDDN